MYQEKVLGAERLRLLNVSRLTDVEDDAGPRRGDRASPCSRASATSWTPTSLVLATGYRARRPARRCSATSPAAASATSRAAPASTATTASRPTPAVQLRHLPAGRHRTHARHHARRCCPTPRSASGEILDSVCGRRTSSPPCPPCPHCPARAEPAPTREPVHPTAATAAARRGTAHHGPPRAGAVPSAVVPSAVVPIAAVPIAAVPIAAVPGAVVAKPAKRPAGLAATNARRGWWLAASVGVLAVCCLLSIVVGTKNLSPGTIWDAFAHYTGTTDQAIVRDLRVPRTVLAILRRRRARHLRRRHPGGHPQPPRRHAGPRDQRGRGAVRRDCDRAARPVQHHRLRLVRLRRRRRGHGARLRPGRRGRGPATPVRLLLAGVALGAVLEGISSGVRLIRPRAFYYLRFWDVGALTGRGWDVIGAVAPFVVAGLVLALLVARSLNTVALGDDLARSLGANLGRTRAGAVLSVTLLAGAATAAVGPIGFVGLMVPHVARWITGPDQRWIFAYTLVGGPYTAARRRRPRPGRAAPRRAAGRDRDRVRGGARAHLAGPPPLGERAVNPMRQGRRDGGPSTSDGRRWCCRLGPAASFRLGVRTTVTCVVLLLLAAGVAVLALGTGEFTATRPRCCGPHRRGLPGRPARRRGVAPAQGPAGPAGRCRDGPVRRHLPGADPQPARQPRRDRLQHRRLHRRPGRVVFVGRSYPQTATAALVGGVATAAVVYLLSLRRGVQGFRLSSSASRSAPCSARQRVVHHQGRPADRHLRHDLGQGHPERPRLGPGPPAAVAIGGLTLLVLALGRGCR